MSNLVVSTSAESYHRCLEEGLINAKQNMVIAYMLRHKNRPIYCGEIKRYHHDVCSSFSPRFIELEECGVIKCVGKVKDAISNRNVRTYILTGKIPTERVRRKKKTVYALCYTTSVLCGHGELGSAHLSLITKPEQPYNIGPPEPVYSTREKAEAAVAKLPRWKQAEIVELEVK